MRYIGQDFSKKYFYGIRCYAIPDIMLMLGLPFAIEDSCANVFLNFKYLHVHDESICSWFRKSFNNQFYAVTS